jgi:branched-chain amino acid transport system ATP-binding protein
MERESELVAMLQLDRVSVSYGAIRALHGVSLSVAAGQVVTLIGANGAGKSTTLRAITGLLKPTSGRVVFEGHEVTGLPPHKLVARGISMCPEGRGIFANLTVIENLEMGAYLQRSVAEVRHDMERGFEMFPRLKERMKQRGGTLSGGEQQMLAMARALLARPKLLLLDEPSLGLAPLVCRTILNTIDEIKAGGTTVLLVEQNATAALKHSDYAYVLETGTVALEGTPTQIAGDTRVRAAYLGR